jgi:hypothetical protein
MCVDCVLASPRITQVDPDNEPLFEVVLSQAQDTLNIIKMKDLYDTQDCRAKQYYPDTIPNPKGIGRYSI